MAPVSEASWEHENLCVLHAQQHDNDAVPEVYSEQSAGEEDSEDESNVHKKLGYYARTIMTGMPPQCSTHHTLS
jgi:hypothetical protein